ncbi:MAG: hypothetical protein IMW93_02430 [Thermoanaerobacteraceae bacterium]|nr:hypothetical protein [Thermoanaerobacteraceae bacterium]
MAEGRNITISQAEIQQMRIILMDDDGEEAIKFLREVLLPKVQEQESHACGTLGV